MDEHRAELAEQYGLVVDDGEVPALAAVGDGALTLVNLFALHAEARYEDGAGGSGLEAMLRYASVSGDRLARVGGRFLTQALPTGTVWGDDEAWDVLVVASYPSVEAFWSLLADPGYRQAFVHRRAAVARQRVTVGIALT